MAWQRVYAVVWRRVAAVVVTVGALVFAVVLALTSPEAGAVALALLLVVVLLRRAHHASDRRAACPPAVPPEAWRAGAVMLAGGSAFLVAAIGWDALVGAAGDVLVVAVALAGAPLVAWDELSGRLAASRTDQPVRREHQVSQGAAVRQPEPVDPAEAEVAAAGWPAPRPPSARPEPVRLLPSLSDDELWHAWHASTRALCRATTPGVRLRIVAVRELYLNALVERDPDGFAAQLGGGRDWTSAGG